MCCQAALLGCVPGMALFLLQAPAVLGASLGAGSSSALSYHPAWSQGEESKQWVPTAQQVLGRGCSCRQGLHLPFPSAASQTALCSCFAGSRPGAGAGWGGRLAGSGCAD